MSQQAEETTKTYDFSSPNYVSYASYGVGGAAADTTVPATTSFSYADYKSSNEPTGETTTTVERTTTTTYTTSVPTTYAYTSTTQQVPLAGITASHGYGATTLSTSQTFTAAEALPASLSQYAKEIPLATSEIKREETQKQSRTLAQSIPGRFSEGLRLSLLAPYRQTSYSEFELVEDLPDRRYLVDSINLLLQQSQSKEALLVSPSRVSIKRHANLGPAEILVESLFKEKYEDGSIYEGEVSHGTRHGKGKIIYKDGSVFEGQFNNGRAEGTGILTFKTGKVHYEGGFNDTTFQGQGILHCETPIPLNGGFDHTNFENLGSQWTKYEGEFHNGKKHGNGTLILTNGEKFTGEFRDDRIEGRGTFTRADGATVQGIWSNNKFQSAL